MKKELGLLFSFFFFFLSCATVQLENKLTAEDKEFLSTVRYIITTQERKTFLNLPPSERQAFIEEFWRKRDPDPETEINEFKVEYYKRIEAAKNLFREGGKSGWLQDRGRIYVLFGPPDQRETYPRGYGFNELPMEIWHYGFYRLIFIDYNLSGNYELQPQSAQMIAEMSQVQMKGKPRDEAERVSFDFNLDIKKTAEGEALFIIEIPYEKIWLSAEEEELKTTVDMTIEIFDTLEKKVLEEKTSYPLSLKKEKLKDVMGKNYEIQIPIRLDPGEYRAAITLKNLTDQTQVTKKIKLTV